MNPGISLCDKLLQFLTANKEISFLSVTHSVNSGFVTTRQSKYPIKNKVITHQYLNVDAMTISNDDVKNWRDDLKIHDGKEILVTLA